MERSMLEMTATTKHASATVSCTLAIWIRQRTHGLGYAKEHIMSGIGTRTAIGPIRVNFVPSTVTIRIGGAPAAGAEAPRTWVSR